MRTPPKIIVVSIIVTIIAINSEWANGLRILGIFPLKMKSHFAMNEQLMKGLAAKGHQVDVYSHFPLDKPIENYREFTIVDPLVANFTNNLNPACFLAFGRYLNLPIVTIETLRMTDWTYSSFSSPHYPAIMSSAYAGFSAPMNFCERLKNFLITNYMHYGFYWLVKNQDKYVKQYFGDDYPSTGELLKDVDLMLINYNQMLHGVRPYTPAIVPVGGLHIDTSERKLSEKVQKFLDDSETGFVYFSFGSMVRIETFPEHILKIFYDAFRKIAPIRVLWKIAKPEELPSGLPDNVLTDTWLPQMEVLKHKNIKAFITHGGLMGTMEAIYNAVPMIGIPLFVDQYANMDLYKKRKIAVSLNYYKINNESFIQALEEILENPNYKLVKVAILLFVNELMFLLYFILFNRKEIAKLSQSFRDTPMSPLDTAAYWIEFIARNGKKSLRSPLVDMHWWQTSILDVYMFVAVVVFLIVSLVAIIVQKFKRLLLRCMNKSKKVKVN
ncbi:unnamed protein product [Trichogramma brassicae]|uniref:UDP-glucuronosyltransferase n=1 Tax=Trichogramma brassicae TaxID=86971 RepID=A0A6H5IK28_9HYME|nr:unnamed protein product [Trichogramma brassicae]